MIVIKKNSKMNILSDSLLSADIKYNELLKDIRVVKIQDSIIVDDNVDVKKANDYYEKALKRLGGKVGYEASCNEIFITGYMNDEMTIEDGMHIVVDLVKILDEKIRRIKPDIRECYILSVDNNSGNIIFRFHEINDGELWVDSDLENYDEPVAVFISKL